MKNKLFFFLFFLFSTLLSGNVMAQEVIERSTDKTKIGGKEYYLHRVRQGQTLYSLSKAYNVSVEEIELLNPEVKDGLKVGHVLGIPVRPVQEPKVEEPLPVTVKPEPEPVSEQKPVTVKPVKPEPKEEPVVVKPEPESVKVKPVKPEPKEEPVVEKPETESEPEPVKVKPVKPEPKEEPVVVQPEPEPEPVVVEPVNPEPVPVVEQEPAPEPELEPKTVVVKPVKPEPEPVVEQPKEQETPVVIEPQPNHKPFFDGKARIVQHGEDLYDIAKEYGIDVADLKQANPRMTFEDPKEGTRIVIPQVTNENDYIVHSCEYNERVSSLLKRWKVDENAFRNINVSVGSHVFENQVVLIPIQPITDFYWIPQEKEQDEVVEVVEVEEPEESQDIQEHQPLEFDFETGDIPDCVAAPENASKRYHVALMVPLYLNNIGSVDVSKDNASKTKKSRPMSFLQFYEGFMIAAEAMEKQGMKLDLTVIDVTDNTATAENAVAKIQNKDLDLIVGPFFGNSFDIVEEYAKAKHYKVVDYATVLGDANGETRADLSGDSVHPNLAGYKLMEEALMKVIKKNEVLYTEISKFPAVSRDLALLVDNSVEFAQIEQVARQTEKKLLKKVELFDVYEGDKLPVGKKSYAVNFILQDEEKTMGDKQIDAIMQKLIANIKKQLNAELR